MAKTGSKHIRYITLSDNELISLAQKGEQIAFTILFERHYHGLISHISEILYDKESSIYSKEMSEEPQDICQETFHKAFTHIGDYLTKYKFSTWLYNIAKNTTIDYIRKNKKTKENTSYSPENSNDFSNLIVKNSDTPEGNLIDTQEFERTKNVINTLSNKYRDAIYLYAVEGYGYEEIADELGVSVSAAKVRVNRAKNLLADMLKDQPLAQKRAHKVEKKRASVKTKEQIKPKSK